MFLSSVHRIVVRDSMAHEVWQIIPPARNSDVNVQENDFVSFSEGTTMHHSFANHRFLDV